MKLTTKIALSIALCGFVFLLVFSVFFYIQSSKRLEDQFVHNAENHMNILSRQVRQLIINEINTAKIMGNNELILSALEESNNSYALYGREDRVSIIEDRNERWMAADFNDPFVRGFTENPAAEYLKRQQTLIPGHYGEIFLTNRFGTVAASTSKLTTFAHAHKYWWERAYYEGVGQPFVDDRGYDESVEGYVLGIVVPVYRNGQVIGILKCNIDIYSFLENLQSYTSELGDEWHLLISRSNGLIISGQNIEPLSTALEDELIASLQRGGEGFDNQRVETSQKLYVISPIQATVGDNLFRFGGSPASVDHRQGNEGNHWVFLGVADIGDVKSASRDMLLLLLTVGILFVLALLAAAYLVSRGITRKIRNFIPAVQEVGGGNLAVKLPEEGNDEIGLLARSFNGMVSKLSSTLTSKDKLEKLVEEKEYLMKELNHRVKNNLTIITSLINLKNTALPDNIDLSDLIHQIDAIRIVHEQLYQTESVGAINIYEYLEDLLTSVFSFHLTPVNISIDIEQRSLQTKRAITIGLIVNEIATNAIKHGFTSAAPPGFSISLKSDIPAQQYILVLSNSGSAFPEDIDLDNAETLGLRLISALVSQLNGTIELQRKPHPVFTIKFPIN